MVVLEAMASGLPVVCLDFGGPGEMVTSDVGIKVPIKGRREVIRGLADALIRISQDRTWLDSEKREYIAQKVRSNFSWDAKVKLIAKLYDHAPRAANIKAR